MSVAVSQQSFYMDTDTSEFHTIVTYQKIFLLFFSSFFKVSQLIGLQEQAEGWIWPMGYTLYGTKKSQQEDHLGSSCEKEGQLG
jgi:hypothetical protein